MSSEPCKSCDSQLVTNCKKVAECFVLVGDKNGIVVRAYCRECWNGLVGLVSMTRVTEEEYWAYKIMES